MPRTPLEPLRSFFELADELREELAWIDAARDRFLEADRAGRILPNTLDAIRLELTYHSNAIEGNTLTLRETQLVLEGKTPPGTHPLREVYEARNHARALELIEGWAHERSADSAITDRDVLDIHASVMADIDARNAGRFRADRVLIAGTRFVPPSARKFDELIPAMLAWANAREGHPVLRAAEVHYNFVAIHPFTDGNGRTARLLMNDVLIRNGYSLSVFEVEHRGEYLGALDEANTGNVGTFARLVIGCVQRSLVRLLGEPE